MFVMWMDGLLLKEIQSIGMIAQLYYVGKYSKDFSHIYLILNQVNTNDFQMI
jgi:hypothetical protein